MRRLPIRPECDESSKTNGKFVDVLAGEAEEDLGDLFGEQSGKEFRGDMAFPSDEPSGEASWRNEAHDWDIDEEEFAPKIVAKDPGSPTQAEVDEHNVDHFPFRAWCECCVQGRGTGEQHVPGVESHIPILAFD